MDIGNLTKTEIIERQYSLLEELKQELTNQDTPISFDSGEGIDIILTQAFNGETKSEQMSARVKPSAKQIIDSSNYSCADAIEYFACILNNEENSLQNTAGYGDGTNSYGGEFIDHSEKEITRNSPEYREFHNKVLKRDGVCQCCGSSEDLEVHHCLPFNEYNSLGADPKNGIVLCKSCHGDYHSEYGYKRNVNPMTLVQFVRENGKQFQSKLDQNEGVLCVGELSYGEKCLLDKMEQQMNSNRECSLVDLTSSIGCDSSSCITDSREFETLVERGFICQIPNKERIRVV